MEADQQQFVVAADVQNSGVDIHADAGSAGAWRREPYISTLRHRSRPPQITRAHGTVGQPSCCLSPRRQNIYWNSKAWAKRITVFQDISRQTDTLSRQSREEVRTGESRHLV